MIYRTVEKIPTWKISELSYGCMRFKDQESAVEAIGKAIDLGVNYYDVAPMYGWGTAEPFLGAGIKGRRDGLIITAKSSPGNGGGEPGDYQPKTGFGIRSADETRRQIEQSMKLLGVDHLDMYHLWAVHGEAVWQEAMKPGGFMEGVLKARDEGLFDYIGITTHGNSDEIIHYVRDSVYEFDLVTLPFHLRDTSRAKAVAYCAERGIGVIAMNPLAGGMLARPLPALKKISDDLGFSSMVEASLRFAANFPGVTSALNGLTFASQVEEGVEAVGKGPIEPERVQGLSQRLQELYANVRHFCSACGYCGECPVGLQIPKILEAYSNLLLPSQVETEKLQISDRMASDPGSFEPSLCVACKKCEEKCPNKLPIASLMQDAANIWPTI